MQELDRWQRVKEIFCAALEREPGERAAYLADQCAGEMELQTEIQSLLEAHAQANDFIERPAAREHPGLDEPEPPAWTGRRLGVYRIVSEIGRGGMSVVYKAVRDDDDFHKEVAVKVLRRGYDTQSLLRRFRTEKQILATLDHPNIARILDGGSTDEGLPYLVMDYVNGAPIDEYVGQEALSISARLELFRTLCSTVQYVHQHLMVHADLKESNVLVTEAGALRLLDFGIAKLMRPAQVPGEADPRMTSVIAFTPEYASPEQIRGGQVTTASDVYSLGVMLYRLLAGETPFQASGQLQYKLAAQICETDPVPPSVTARMNASGRAVGSWRDLTGDLDAIVLMALQKDPANRYASVAQMEEDIRRHLDGFPVLARTPGLRYNLAKFVGRHKAGVTAATLFVLTLVGGIVATSWQAHVAREERARAERHFTEVRKLANTFMFDVHSAIENLPGATPARHVLVSNSLRYLDALSRESGSDASLRRELATAYEKLADVQGGFRAANLGDTTGAIASYREALKIRNALLANAPAEPDLRRELLRNYGKLSEVVAGVGDRQGAIESARRAVELAEQLAASSDSTTYDRRNLGSTYVSLGWQLASFNEVERGLALMNHGTAVFETLVDADPRDARTRHNLAVAYGRLGETLSGSTHRYATAYQMHTRELEIVRGLLAEDPHNFDLQTIEAYALLGMGTALSKQGTPRAALSKRMDAMNTLRALFNADVANQEARYNAAFALAEVGETQVALGDTEAAERNLRESLEILSPAIDTRLSAAKVLQGTAYFRLGQIDARHAADPGVPRAAQKRHCAAAERWFEHSRPILAAAELDEQWRKQLSVQSGQIDRELAVCTTPKRSPSSD
ncbi:MAG: ppkA [Gammaproteobacteria bacterium]|nr:ppkA [Gammaproteobacteria bacterium]